MKARILIGIASSVVCATALAATGGSQMENGNANSNSTMQQEQMDQAHEQAFQKLDTNNDGVISAEEAKQDPSLRDKFASVDHNKDRQIQKGEFSAFELKPAENR